ncbi:signal peptide containing protein [Theileria equi strain WA]|uniref:Signal peptide containing protein n=1 Tax=Theileria equi strain WA TaxID=1537102 RepID=L1LB27_THEEQ|nr:signal peptide containing protein [Theileria equi strain WA]EKX72480.1 signal peptide containing protein [Theileria equi strain WA]|eukprot:XP_004831932.1 signal peptide containing protein [Theileria equi strain WA]
MVICCHVLFLSLVLPGIWASSVKHPVISLDIGRRVTYNSAGHDINVKRHERDGQVFYYHTLSRPSKLSEITVDGHYIHADLFPLEDELILSSLVYWRYDRPDMLTLNMERSQVFLWNNGNGRLVPQASTLDNYGKGDANAKVTLDVSQTRGYSAECGYMNVRVVEETNLPGYKVYRHKSRPFLLEKVTDGGWDQFGITVPCEITSAYVYKWDEKPLILRFELFNFDTISFVCLINRWVRVDIPGPGHPGRYHYMRKLLSYLNCASGESVIIQLRNTVNGHTYADKCTFPNLPTLNGASMRLKVIPMTGHLQNFKEFKHTSKGGHPFEIRRIMYDKRDVLIDVPNKPVESVSFIVKSTGNILNSAFQALLRSDLMDIIEIHSDIYEYYRCVGGLHFVKFAESNVPLRNKGEFRHIENYVLVWKDGKCVDTGLKKTKTLAL